MPLLALITILPLLATPVQATLPAEATEPVLHTSPALPPSGRQTRRIVVAEEVRRDYAGATVREMFNIAATEALPPQPLDVAGRPALRYLAQWPAGDGGLPVQHDVIIVFDTEATHLLWARRTRGEGPSAALDRLRDALRFR